GFSASGTALALDPKTWNLYVDHGSDVAMYDPTGIRIDTLFSLGVTTNSQGLAYHANGPSPGHLDLYVSDASNDTLTIYGPRPAGAPVHPRGAGDERGKDEGDAACDDRPARLRHDLPVPARHQRRLPRQRLQQCDERAVHALRSGVELHLPGGEHEPHRADA